MRVFMTGSTGYIGSAVVKALVRRGHQVSGLVRTAEREAMLGAVGGTPVRGDLTDPSTYRHAAAEHDVSVHIAFDYGPNGVQADRRATEALLEATRGAGASRYMLYTSGVLVLGHTGDTPVDERASTAGAVPLVAWRPAHEQLVLAAATEMLATAVIRPGFVYGGVKGIAAGYFESAVDKGAAVYVGDGKNRMALVHRDDLAELYRLLVEKRASGMFHGVDGAASSIAELARAASEAAGRGGATRSLPVEEARKTMGPLADAVGTDQVIITHQAPAIGWATSHRPFVEAAREMFEEWRREARGA